MPHDGVRPFHQKSTCLIQLTLGRYVVQIWSRGGHVPLRIEGNETLEARSVVWLEDSRDLSGTGASRAEDAPGTPTQSHISLSIPVYEHKMLHRLRGRSQHDRQLQTQKSNPKLSTHL